MTLALQKTAAVWLPAYASSPSLMPDGHSGFLRLGGTLSKLVCACQTKPTGHSERYRAMHAFTMWATLLSCRDVPIDAVGGHIARELGRGALIFDLRLSCSNFLATVYSFASMFLLARVEGLPYFGWSEHVAFTLPCGNNGPHAPREPHPDRQCCRKRSQGQFCNICLQRMHVQFRLLHPCALYQSDLRGRFRELLPLGDVRREHNVRHVQFSPWRSLLTRLEPQKEKPKAMMPAYVRGVLFWEGLVSWQLLVCALDWPDSSLSEDLVGMKSVGRIPASSILAPAGTEILESTPVAIFLHYSKIWTAELASRRLPTNDHQSLAQWTAVWEKCLLAAPEAPSLMRLWTGSLASVAGVAFHVFRCSSVLAWRPTAVALTKHGHIPTHFAMQRSTDDEKNAHKCWYQTL